METKLSDILTITEAAAEHMRKHMAAQTPAPEGVLINVKPSGCSGFSYDLRFLDKLADAPKNSVAYDERGLKIVLAPSVEFYMRGTEIDFQKEGLTAALKFKNPLVTDTCGCGESFTTGPRPS